MIRRRNLTLLFLVVTQIFGWLSGAASADTNCTWVVKRFATNLIIHPGMSGLEGAKGLNINGPSVIRVPDWIKNPLGRYYLYFAHHQGRYIRLAYATNLQGPWKIYAPGTLQLKDTAARDHIASPDVHVDNARQEIRMYFHGFSQSMSRQVTSVATSRDGLHFKAVKSDLGPFYFRVFKYQGWYYAIAKLADKSGVIMRSVDGLSPFEEGPQILPRMRHAAVLEDRDRLFLFYTRVGDNPESILMSEMSLNGDWRKWSPSAPIMVLRPEMGYEGVNLPASSSRSGMAIVSVREVRDPYVFKDDGKLHLFYSVMCEKGVSLADLNGSNGCFSKRGF
jgi:hypothetical protein